MSESEKKEVKVTRTDEKGQEKTHIYTESHIERTPAGDNIHVMTKEEEELSIKAKRAGMAFQDLITSAVDKAKAVTKEKTKGLAKQANEVGAGGVSAAVDAKDIAHLGPMVEELARHFEGTMNEMRQYSYTDQADLLTGYKKLLEEQIKVIDARLHYIKRL
jgi:hypothetical protein